MSVVENKTLEELENDYWREAPNDVSRLVKQCHFLRKKPINQFEIEDIRLLIGQNIGLKYLIPKALKIVKNNPFAEGDFYEGDLLENLLTSDSSFWKSNLNLKEELIEVVESNKQSLKDYEDLTDEIKQGIFKAFENFKEI